MRRRSRRVVLAVTAVALVAIAGAITYAVAGVGDGGVINGCYKSQNGQLRVIDPAADHCLPSEAAISWGQTGTQGPPGPPGPAGPTGPQGPAGAPATNLFAAVSGGCSGIFVGSGALSAALGAPARCDVRFNRNVSGCLAIATTRRVGGPDQEEARFLSANTTGELEGVGFFGHDPDEVAVIGYDSTGGFVVPPVPFKVVVFCPSSPSVASTKRVTKRLTRKSPADRSVASGRKRH